MTIGFDIGRASRPKPGESVCGDHVLVLERPSSLLISVIDGLGHGPHASAAASAAAAFLTENADWSLEALLLGCDRAIAGTRGVAMTILRVSREAPTIWHAGVGNVELLTPRGTRFRPAPTPGIVGGRVRRVREETATLNRGDMFILISDGISSRVELERLQGRPAQSVADALLQDHAKQHDDASCAVLIV